MGCGQGYRFHREVSDDEVVFLAYNYLHGELQDINGYDCMGVLKEELSEYITSEDSRYVDIPEGIYNCTCMDIPSTLFRWHDGYHYCGLVVAKRDKKAYEYAMKKYQNKSNQI